MNASSTLRRLLGSTLCTLALAVPGPAAAQNWPERAITIVMPYAAGGATDVAVRDIARTMSDILGQPIVIDNKPGGGATIGAQAVARAKPDGYTLLTGVVANMVTNPLLMPAVPYDPLKAFSAVSLLSANPLILVASKQSGINSLDEAISFARANPGSLAIASYGNGTPSHLAIELLQTTAKIEVTHVPYNGSAAAALDVLGGRIPLLMDILPAQLANLESGRVVGLALGQANRSELAPQVPTFDEVGLKKFEATTWFGLLAPAGTPSDVIARLNAAVRQALSDPALRKSMMTRGTVPSPTTAEEFRDFIQRDYDKWGTVITNSGIKLK